MTRQVPDIKKIREERDATSSKRKQVLEYHKKYNEEHAKELAERKKARYANDPAYAEAAKKRARAAYQRRKKLTAEIRKITGALAPPKSVRAPGHLYCPTCLQPIPRPPRPVYKSVGKKYAVAMYTVREVARRLGKQVKTVQLWIQNGVIPDTLYKDRRTREGTTHTIMTRLWTQDQVEMLMRVTNKYDLRPPVSFEKIGLIADLRAEWDKLRPLGINPALYTVPTEHGLLARPSPELPVPGYAQRKAVNNDEQ